MNKPIKYFLAQDVYSNWYCLPESERQTWDRLMKKEDIYNYDAWHVIESYKVDINNLTFENPNLALTDERCTE